MKMTVADVILKHLEAEGVECIFGVPGTTVVPLLAATNRNPAVRPILAKHEEGAAFMADGYARVKGTIGACFSTSGPGATNLVSGVATAFMDNVPVLVLTGQVDTSVFGKGAFQDSTKEGIDSVKMFEPMTRHSSMVISRHKAVEDIQMALRKAMSGRKGPVHLSLPKDILAAEVEFPGVASSAYRFRTEYFDRRLVIDAAEQLVNADWPAILVGSGAVDSGACEEILELAEMLHIPVATTPKAKGAFPEDHPLALGVLGFCGSPLAEKYIKSGKTDVLFVVGASLNQVTTGSWDPLLAPTKSLIHINIDPAEIGKNYPATIPLVGDARTVVNEISFRVLRHLGDRQPQLADRAMEVSRFRQEWGMCLDPGKMESEEVPLKPQRLVRELQEALPADAILFSDVGNCLGWTIHYMRFQRPGSYIAPFGLLTMGYGIAAAVGGKFAAGDRPVVCLSGDGSFMMNGMEIQTAVSHDLPVVFIIMNNQKLGLVHDLQTFVLKDKTVATRFRKIDAAKVGEGLGAVGYTVEKPGELRALLPRAIASRRTTVIDCIIDSSEVCPLAPFVEGVKKFVQRLDYA